MDCDIKIGDSIDTFDEDQLHWNVSVLISEDGNWNLYVLNTVLPDEIKNLFSSPA